jgi:D-arabinose 1-dehydrogenase-like Zn-dependent alcohol dehydrogenase
MQAVTLSDRAAGLRLTDQPYPHAAENDIVVEVHAAGFTRGELDRPGTWTDRAGHDRTPTVPGTSCPVSSWNSATALPA